MQPSVPLKVCEKYTNIYVYESPKRLHQGADVSAPAEVLHDVPWSISHIKRVDQYAAETKKAMK